MPDNAGGKVILITGGTDGLGKAAAILFAERGYRVFATGRSAEKLAQLDALAKERKLPLESLRMDVLDDASVKQGVATVLEKAGAIDVLVNNAGLGYMATIEDLKVDDFRRQFETNVFAVIRVTQAVLPHMRQRRSGRILMMSSVAGLVAPPLYGAYSGSKFAVEGLSGALRLELYPFGIDVVLIEPGYIVTNFAATAAEIARPYFEAGRSGPYAKIYENSFKSAQRRRETSRTTPEDCARVMLRAIEARRPKIRYGVTPLAVLAIVGRRLWTDRMMDGWLRRAFGIARAT
jgi:NAD(P)-dependent dehydrogenase (short-subunit alcohol dehydrogenase family)